MRRIDRMTEMAKRLQIRLEQRTREIQDYAAFSRRIPVSAEKVKAHRDVYLPPAIRKRVQIPDYKYFE